MYGVLTLYVYSLPKKKKKDGTKQNLFKISRIKQQNAIRINILKWLAPE